MIYTKYPYYRRPVTRNLLSTAIRIALSKPHNEPKPIACHWRPKRCPMWAWRMRWVNRLIWRYRGWRND